MLETIRECFHLYHSSVSTRFKSVEQGLQYVAAWNMSMLQSSDTAKAMSATLDKKPATFPGFSDAKL